MRNNWNFSHSVTPRSEAFGRVDSATTSNGAPMQDRTRMMAKRRIWVLREAEVVDDMGRKVGIHEAERRFTEQFGW